MLDPIIELGRNAGEQHYMIGNEASNICSYVLLTNSNFYDEIARGVADSKGKCLVYVKTVNGIVEFINKNTKLIFKDKYIWNTRLYKYI